MFCRRLFPFLYIHCYAFVTLIVAPSVQVHIKLMRQLFDHTPNITKLRFLYHTKFGRENSFFIFLEAHCTYQIILDIHIKSITFWDFYFFVIDQSGCSCISLSRHRCLFSCLKFLTLIFHRSIFLTCHLTPQVSQLGSRTVFCD